MGAKQVENLTETVVSGATSLEMKIAPPPLTGSLPSHSLAVTDSSSTALSREAINEAIQQNPSLLSPATLSAAFRNLLESAHIKSPADGRRLDFDALDQRSQIEFFMAKEYAQWLLERVFGLRVVKDRPISSSIREARGHLQEEKDAGRWARGSHRPVRLPHDVRHNQALHPGCPWWGGAGC